MPTMEIKQEEYVEDPRKEYDHLGTMVCWHRNYTLGDEQPKHGQGAWLHGLMCELDMERIGVDGHYTEAWEDFVYELENDDPKAMQRAYDMAAEQLIIMPLYLYDHSGITMRTNPFHCPWDSGQVGWIYVTKAAVREEWGWKRISAQRDEKIRQLLKAEVEVYDQYLTGDVWYYVIKDDDGEHLDSLGWMYGYDYCKAEAERALAEYNKYAFFDWLFGLFRHIEECIEEAIDNEERAMAQIGPTLIYA